RRGRQKQRNCPRRFSMAIVRRRRRSAVPAGPIARAAILFDHHHVRGQASRGGSSLAGNTK
ncbi:hypothetical protein EJB05_08785, partial [Eragrostis curvula]